MQFIKQAPFFLILLTLLSPQPTKSETTCLFSYFKNNGEDGMHLAYSEDGVKFTALNNDQSLIQPQIGKDRLMRDPSITRGPDGMFHLVWTSGWNDRCIGYARSEDLIEWSEQDSIFVMEHEPTARNCWAPEIFYDDASKQFIIVWSTTIPGLFPETQATCDNSYNHRLYYITSPDCNTFSETQLLYDPGFNCIDGFIAKEGDKYLLVLKNETCTGGGKNFRLATADSVTGPYGDISGVLSTGSSWVEGPSLTKIDETWYLYYDRYRDGAYGVRKSDDSGASWEYVTDNMDKPSGARHGTVFAVEGFVRDNSTAGFHWETTSAAAPPAAGRKTQSPTISISAAGMHISASTREYSIMRLYTAAGKLIAEIPISNSRNVISKSAIGCTSGPSLYMITFSGKSARFTTTVIWQ